MQLRTSRAAIEIAAAVLSYATGALADDDVEDVHVHGTQANGFQSRTKVEDSPREITDMASLLEPLVGVHIRRLGADDGFATLSVRGSSSNEVAFYFAGVPLPAASDPTVDLSTLPLWAATSARVYRTFAPAALGPGSLGGTLAIDPPAGAQPTTTDVWMAGGSFGEMRARLTDISDLGRGARLATGLSASRTDGDFDYYDVAHNPPSNDPRAYVPRTNNDSAQASGVASLYFPLARGSVRTTLLLQDREQGLAGSIFIPTPFQRLHTNRELATVELATTSGPGVVSAQVWGVRQETAFRDAPNTALGPAVDDALVVSAGSALTYKLRAARLSVTAKIDAHGERFEPEQYIGPNVPHGADRLTAGAGVDVEWQPTRRLTVAGALRGDAWRDASAIAAPSLAALPNGHVGIESRLGSVLVAAHAGYTSRPANFVELFGTPGGFIANPTLKPESAFTVDTGARTQRRIGPLRIEAEVDAFAQSASDIITFVTVSERALPHAENIGAAVLLGAEASVRLRAWGIDLRASYSGLFSENTSACTFEGTCPPLPGRPAHDLVLDASYTLAPFTIRYGLDVVAGIDLDPAGTIEVPARALQSVGVRIDVPRLRGVRVSADVRNVFDVRTATYAQPFNGTNVTYPIGDAYYYPLAGRSVLLSVGWQPRRLASGDASLALEIGTTNPP